MRLSLPERVSMRHVLWFTACLLAVELLEGSTLWLAIATQMFLLVSAVAFNIVGGFMYPSGACIFFNAVLTLGLGAVLKAFLGESLQSNLLAPTRTIPAYLAGMVSILVAAFFSTRLRSRSGLLERMRPNTRVKQMAAGCMLLAVLTPFLIPDSLQGTFAQFLTAFILFAILLPVSEKVKQTNGRSSFTVVAFIAWSYLTIFYGIINFSKQGLFAPSAAWALAAFASGYRCSIVKLATVALIAGIAVTLLTPYSQVARNYRGQDNERAMTLELLEHPLRTRDEYNKSIAQDYSLGYGYHWFDVPQGLLDRLTTIPVDDALFYSTDTLRRGTPIALWSYVINIVPRYLYPGKPTITWGNVYAHDIGLLAEDDDTTGISFTPYADAYHTAGWTGLTLYLGLFFFVMFYVCDSVAGSLLRTEWGLAYIMYFSHAANEGMLAFTTYAISNLTAALLCAAFILTYVAPVVGSMLLLERAHRDRFNAEPHN